MQMSESTSINDVTLADTETTCEEFRIDEEEKELKCLLRGRNCSGFSEAYLLIQKNHKEKRILLKEIDQLEHQQDKTLALLGSEIFDLQRFWNRMNQDMASPGHTDDMKGFEIILNRMWKLLDERDVEVEDLTGKPITDQLLNSVEVLKYLREPERIEPIVKEMKLPVIRRSGRLIQTGEIIAAVASDED
jgi:hypothetical protein